MTRNSSSSAARSGASTPPEAPSQAGGDDYLGLGEDFRCAVSADLVRRALMATSSDETRYYLRGVHVSPHPDGGAYIVGTSGAALLCFHDPEAVVSGQGIVSPDEWLVAALSEPQRGVAATRLLIADARHLLVADVKRDAALALLDEPTKDVLAAQYREATIDGRFPNWRKALLKPRADLPIPPLDGRLLKRLARALNEDKRRAPVGLMAAEAHIKAVWVRGRMPNGFGILAEIRPTGAMTDGPPPWLGSFAQSSEEPPIGAERSDAASPPGMTPNPPLPKLERSAS